MFYCVILSLTFVLAAALLDESSDDESYNIEDNSDKETIGSQETQEDTDVDESEMEDLEEDTAANNIMPTRKSATKPRSKSKSPKKPASNSDVEDLTNHLLLGCLQTNFYSLLCDVREPLQHLWVH